MVPLARVGPKEGQSDSISICNVEVEAARFACGLDVRHVGKKGIDEYSIVLR